MSATRNQNIDALKGVAILIVMVGHVLSWNHMQDGYLYDAIKVIQMPLFMMISGYLCGMGRKVTDLPGYGRVMKKRALSYLVPFFFWIVLLHPAHPIANVVETLFCLDKGLWFLMTLFLLTAMVYTAQLAGAKAGKHGKLVFWLVYLALAAFVVMQSFLGWEFLSPGLTRLYLPFYLAGYLAGEHKERLADISKLEKDILGVLSAGGLLLLVICTDLLDVSSLLLLGRQIFASFLGCYVVILLVMVAQDGKGKRFLAWLGNYTLEIYVLHFHFATVLNQGKTYTLYSLEGVLFVLASFAVMSLITAAIIFVTKKSRILNFLLYGRF